MNFCPKKNCPAEFFPPLDTIAGRQLCVWCGPTLRCLRRGKPPPNPDLPSASNARRTAASKSGGVGFQKMNGVRGGCVVCEQIVLNPTPKSQTVVRP